LGDKSNGSGGLALQPPPLFPNLPSTFVISPHTLCQATGDRETLAGALQTLVNKSEVEVVVAEEEEVAGAVEVQ